MNITRNLLRTGLALSLVLGIASCRTIQYREVQSDFERAVQAETARDESPFVNWYLGVADTLTADYIGNLDEKLRPNAWMLRGISEWRSGSYSNAYDSAANGMQEIDRQKSTTPKLESSRDGIVLTMLPGLVQDSQLRDRLHALGANDLPASSYETNFVPQFKAVLRQLGEAKQKFAAPTPTAVKTYWDYQVWRVLQNWSITLGRLPMGEPSTTLAYANVDTVISNQFSTLMGDSNVTNLTNAIQAAKEAIPADHPYRHLIELEEKQ